MLGLKRGQSRNNIVGEGVWGKCSKTGKDLFFVVVLNFDKFNEIKNLKL